MSFQSFESENLDGTEVDLVEFHRKKYCLVEICMVYLFGTFYFRILSTLFYSSTLNLLIKTKKNTNFPFAFNQLNTMDRRNATFCEILTHFHKKNQNKRKNVPLTGFEPATVDKSG
jgi:hypothetical protein